MRLQPHEIASPTFRAKISRDLVRRPSHEIASPTFRAKISHDARFRERRVGRRLTGQVATQATTVHAHESRHTRARLLLLTRARTRDGWERRRVAETRHSGDVTADTAAVAWAVVSAATGGEVAQRRGGAAAERAGRGGGGEVGGRAVAAFLLEHTRTHSTQSARARAP